MKLQVGDVVEWASAAAGSTKVKRGEVVAVVPRGYPMTHGLRALKDAPFSFDIMARDASIARDEESYLVLVPQKGNRIPFLYWPRTSSLRLANPERQPARPPRLHKRAS